MAFSGCTSKLNGPKQPDTNTAVKPAPLPATPPEPAYDSTAFAPLHPRALASRVPPLLSLKKSWTTSMNRARIIYLLKTYMSIW
jgi:hypothetical protein